MPRDFFEATLGAPDAGGVFRVLSNLRVSVFARDTTTPVNIYQAEVGVAQGPASAAGATGGPNPFFTGSTGSAQFWADLGRYDVVIDDNQAPARVGSRKIQWNAKPLDGIPTSSLADLVITTPKLADLSVTAPKSAVQRVTSLPGSPTDGQEVYYVADAANGIIWHLKYNAGASGSYKWEFLGGGSLRGTVPAYATLNGTGLSTFVAWPSGAGPVVPLAGDYELWTGALALDNASTAMYEFQLQMAKLTGATLTLLGSIAAIRLAAYNSTTAGTRGSVNLYERGTLAANDRVTVAWSGAASSQAQSMFAAPVFARPVRVG
jgi:hypothetical protein